MGAKKCVWIRKMKRLAASFVHTRGPRGNGYRSNRRQARIGGEDLRRLCFRPIRGNISRKGRFFPKAMHQTVNSVRRQPGGRIEHLREMGGFRGIELDDFVYAIRRGDIEWVARFLKRFPALCKARDTQGRPFKMLAQRIRQCRNPITVEVSR